MHYCDMSGGMEMCYCGISVPPEMYYRNISIPQEMYCDISGGTEMMHYCNISVGWRCTTDQDISGGRR